jgi:hypothetical protein
MDVSYPVQRLTTNVERPLKATHLRLLVSATHASEMQMSSLFRYPLPTTDALPSPLKIPTGS